MSDGMSLQRKNAAAMPRCKKSDREKTSDNRWHRNHHHDASNCNSVADFTVWRPKLESILRKENGDRGKQHFDPSQNGPRLPHQSPHVIRPGKVTNDGKTVGSMLDRKTKNKVIGSQVPSSPCDDQTSED